MGILVRLAFEEAVDPRSILTDQPYRAVRAHLLARAEDHRAARAADSQVIGLCEGRDVCDFLIACRNGSPRTRPIPRLDETGHAATAEDPRTKEGT